MTILRFAVLAIVMALGAPGQWLNYPTAGLPRTPDGKPDLAAPTPKTGDGKPDLSGIWLPADNTHFMDLAADLKPEDARISRGREIWPPIDRKGCIKMIPWRSACHLASPAWKPTGRILSKSFRCPANWSYSYETSTNDVFRFYQRGHEVGL